MWKHLETERDLLKVAEWLPTQDPWGQVCVCVLEVVVSIYFVLLVHSVSPKPRFPYLGMECVRVPVNVCFLHSLRQQTLRACPELRVRGPGTAVRGRRGGRRVLSSWNETSALFVVGFITQFPVFHTGCEFSSSPAISRGLNSGFLLLCCSPRTGLAHAGVFAFDP